MAQDQTHRLVQERIDKAEKLRQAGTNPFSNDFKPETTCGEFRAQYADKSKEDLADNNKVTTLAGRLIAKRKMGKMAFLQVRDRSGDLQIVLKKNKLGDDAFDFLKLMDLGDIIGVAGSPTRTNAGELSIDAEGFRVLTKALRPLPDKFHGLADVEQRYRQRYVDLIMNPDVRRIFEIRSKVIRGIRRHLDKRDYIEVETPVLGDGAGGASARPFLTHHNALDMPLQLRIATELHLKRLVVGGLERVYEIGRIFRNEGVSTRHNPEFTSIEFYEAYATYEDLMDLTEDMVAELVDDIHGKEELPYGDNTVNFARPWKRVSIPKLVEEELNVGRDLHDIHSIREALKLVVGNTVSPETPLLVCLAELSDDEAERLIPGIQSGPEGLPERAKRAFRSFDGDFYDVLGENLDRAFADVTVEGDPITSDESTSLGEATGEVLVFNKVYGKNHERRRKVALHLLYVVFDHLVEPKIVNPTFVTGFSVSVSPLARKREGDPAVVDRFELFCGGMELANAFSELNDPIDQKERFLSQLREKERGDVEAQGYDEDFINALEHGMPPTAGEGIGIDRLVMLLTNQPSIREVILFPQMRPLGR